MFCSPTRLFISALQGDGCCLKLLWYLSQPSGLLEHVQKEKKCKKNHNLLAMTENFHIAWGTFAQAAINFLDLVTVYLLS